jgi:hypothetical protein
VWRRAVTPANSGDAVLAFNDASVTNTDVQSTADDRITVMQGLCAQKRHGPS